MTHETINRIVFFIIGCGFGGVLGYIAAYLRIIKEEVHDVLDLERKRDEQGILQHRVAFNVAFVLLMVFVFYAAFSSFQNGRNLEQNVEDDFVRVCKAGEEIRGVQRKTVDAVYTLAIGAVQNSDVNLDKLTAAEKARANLYIGRANAFREESYDAIKPTEPCLEHVTDDHVEPPTPPFPFIK